MSETTEPAAGGVLRTNDIPLDQLSAMANDQTIVYFSVIPLIILGVLAIAWFTIYSIRRKKSWQDLGAAMKEETESMQTIDEDFPESKMSSLKETVPSKKRLDKDS